MIIKAKYASKARSANKIFFVANKEQIKDLKLSAKARKYVSELIEKDKMVQLDDCGQYTAVIKFEKPSDPKNGESIRKHGFGIFEWLKNKCESIQVESTNASVIEFFMEGLILSSYQFDKYLTGANKKSVQLKEVYTSNKNVSVDRINIVADSTCWARDLVNEPVSFLNAPQLAKEIENKFDKTEVKVEVFGKQKIESLKMGGLLAVNKGSVDPPVFISLEWKPKKIKNKKPIILVGKGIVYDTGGLSLKPTAGSMDFMKSDMAGAAAMAATLYAVSALKLPLHVIALIPSTDNRPGGNAYAPGDIITMMDGTTVEVLNTDAEGRMALADALAYSNKFKPELVIDAATLTGAAVAAIGEIASVMMGNADQKELDELYAAGMKTNDRVAPFPFWDEYFEEMKSDIADLKNLGGKYAGMITAGKFLEHFTKHPYIHLDIAGPSFTHRKDNYRGNGGTGAGVRLLVEYLQQKAKK